MYFAVTLWNGAENSPQVQEVARRYKKELNCYAVCGCLLFLATLLPKHESLVITGQMVWLFLVVVVMFIPYGRANRRMLELKREYRASCLEPEREKETAGEAEIGEPKKDVRISAGGTVLIDVTAAGTEKPRLFRKSVFVGIVFAVLPVFAELVLYKEWHNPGAPDLWVNELILLAMAIVTLVFPFCIRYYERQRTQVVTYSSRINIQLARVRQYQWSSFFTAMVWMTGAFNWVLLLSFHVPSNWSVWLIMAGSFIFTVSVIGFVCRCWYIIHKTSEKYLAKETILLEDDDEYWKWGLFYYNKNDNRTTVEKRVGSGFTCNMAKPGMKWGSIIFLVVFLVWMMGMCAWVIAEDFTPVRLEYQEDTVTAVHWKKEYQIEKENVSSVELLEEKPHISRRSGTGMDTVQKGDFYSDEYKQDFQVCLNPQEAPYLLIQTKDGAWYLLGSSDGAETREIYQALAEALQTTK